MLGHVGARRETFRKQGCQFHASYGMVNLGRYSPNLLCFILIVRGRDSYSEQIIGLR